MRGHGRRTDRSIAIVASPFQLVSLFEAMHAGIIAPPTVVVVRFRSADTLLDLGVDLLRRSTVQILPSPRALVDALARSATFVAGDLYSGYLHAAAATGRYRLVLVDDGAATLRGMTSLANGEVALRRAHSVRRRRSPLSRLGTAGLYRLARSGRASVSTGLPMPPDQLEHLTDRGFGVHQHDFAWSRTVPLHDPPAPSGPVNRVVLGSSLATDGLISPSYYRDWLLEQFAHLYTFFVPHRRDLPEAHELAAANDVHSLPRTGGLPAELIVRDLPGVITVATLPSTAALTLPAIRGSQHTRLCCTLPPSEAQTAHLTRSMGALLTMIQQVSNADDHSDRSRM